MPKAARKNANRPQRGRSRPPTALTGVCGYAGIGLLEQLLADEAYGDVVCIDLERPGFDMGRAKFYKVDLTEPTADSLLAEIFAKESIRQVAHAAFLSGPSHDAVRAHEAETIGTLHVLNACAATGVEKIVVPLTTMSYGARPDNPNYLSEDHPLRGDPDYPFIRDKVEVEQLLAGHAGKHPETCVTVLRAAPIVGETSHFFISRYLRMPVLIRIAGFDPLMQFLHQDDLTFALKQALADSKPGVFNLAGEGVIPYSAVIRLLGRARVRLYTAEAWALTSALWPIHLAPFGPRHLNYLRYLFAADTARAAEILRFTPHYSSRDALLRLARA